jgi:hypothetical protein
MRVWLFVAIMSAALLGAAGGVAISHTNGCHSAHSCPSDHHTYVWYDSSGSGWDCAKPGADEYDPSRDTTTITYGGYTYYCRAAGSAPPSPPPPTDTRSTETTTTTMRPPKCKLSRVPDTEFDLETEQLPFELGHLHVCSAIVSSPS